MYVTHAETYIHGLLTVSAQMSPSGSVQRRPRLPWVGAEGAVGWEVVEMLGRGQYCCLPGLVSCLHLSSGFCAFRVGRREALGPSLLLRLIVLPLVPPGARLLPLPSQLYFWSISLEMHAPLSAKLQVPACLDLPVLCASQRWWEGDS